MNRPADLLKELRIDRGAPPPAPSRRGLWIGLVVALVLISGLAIATWLWLGRTRAPQVQVASVTAIGGNGPATVLDASGYVVARRMATVSAKITGRVRDVRIEEGQRVEAGEVLATLDPVDADAQRRLAAAQLGAAESQIGSVRAQLLQAEADAKRYATLVDKQLVSRSQYDQVVAQRDNLRAQLAVATRNAEVARDSLTIADNGVDNTIVRAPFAGVIIAKAAQPGEIVSPLSAGGGFTRTGIGTIVDMDSLEVEVDVGEAFIGRVKPGMPVVTTLNSYPDWKIPGKVIAIIPTADRGKATVKVRISLGVKDPRIVPDMGVRVSFLDTTAPTASERHAVLAPAAALVDRAGQPVAFVLDGEHVRERRVTTGRTLGDDREVTAGLAAGDQVVLDPPTDLRDGSAVRVAPADSGDGGSDDPDSAQ